MVANLPKEHNTLGRFLGACVDKDELCVPECKNTVLELSSSSSILVVFPDRNNGHRMLEDMATGYNPYQSEEGMKMMMSAYPIIHTGLLFLHNSHGGQLPEIVREFFTVICGRIRSLEFYHNNQYDDLQPTESPLDLFPAMPKLRNIPVYKNDDILLDCDPKTESKTIYLIIQYSW